MILFSSPNRARSLAGKNGAMTQYWKSCRSQTGIEIWENTSPSVNDPLRLYRKATDSGNDVFGNTDLDGGSSDGLSTYEAFISAVTM